MSVLHHKKPARRPSFDATGNRNSLSCAPLVIR